MQNNQKYWILVPAAGIGKRMGSELPKQYLEVAGRSILNWTLDRLNRLDNIEQILLILHPEDNHWQQAQIEKLTTTEGGDERFDSVMNGLMALEPFVNDNDWVLVHDAVRPCVALSDIQNLMSRLSNDPVGGLLASPVKDTLKQASANNEVSKTVDRSKYWLAATPQMFRYGLLRKAMENANSHKLAVSDEASAVEALGHTVKLVEGRSDNIKVTHPADLPLVEFLLQQENSSAEGGHGN